MEPYFDPAFPDTNAMSDDEVNEAAKKYGVPGKVAQTAKQAVKNVFQRRAYAPDSPRDTSSINHTYEDSAWYVDPLLFILGAVIFIGAIWVPLVRGQYGPVGKDLAHGIKQGVSGTA